MKECLDCKQNKDVLQFHKHKSKKDGLSPYCKLCAKIRAAASYKRNIDNIKKRVKKYKESHKEETKINAKEWRDSRLEKERIRRKTWRDSNLPIVKELTAKRRASKKQATLDYERYKYEIREIYKNCPVGMQVDHIIPLQGGNVRGLHVPWNLQYLTPLENVVKGNKLCQP